MVGAAGVGLVVALFVALFIAQAADDRAGCGSVDATDPANYSSDYILNDTGSAVLVDECRGDYCRPDQHAFTVAPGQRANVNAACAEPASSATPWRVTSDGHLLIGYITIVTPKKTDDLVFPASHARPRRGLAVSPEH